MKQSIRFLFAFSLFIEIMMGAEAWFVWPIETGLISKVIQVVILGIAFLYKTIYNIKLTNNASVITAFIFFSAGVVFTQPQGLSFVVGLVCRLYPLWVLISDKDISYYLKFIQRALVLILIPGLLIHVVLIHYQDLPGIPYNRYYIYGFAIKPVFSYDEYIRFQSVFLEPSYLGTLMSFLLYADKYNLKQFSNKVFFVSLLASLSLAGLVLAAIGFIICNYSKNRRLAVLFPALFVLGLSYAVAVNYNDGDNVVNERVIKRLQRDDEDGIAGNNRFTNATDEYYDRLLSTGGILMGLGPDTVERINGGAVTSESYDNSIAGAGYKVYFVTYGLLSALFFLAFYILMSRIGYNKLYRNGFVFIIVLTFIQAAYPQSFSWIIPFLIGMKLDRLYCNNTVLTVLKKIQ